MTAPALRLALGLPGAAADVVLRAAALAEQWNLDGLWIGDPGCVGGLDGTVNRDDTYVLVAAAAAAAVTTDLRLGVFLSARSSAPALRLAEDIAVVDQISGGRLELGFVPPADPDPGWEADVERILAAPRDWRLSDGRAMPVTPAPAQPVVPTVMVEGPGAGPLVARARCGPERRSLLMVAWPEPVKPPAAADLISLREEAARAGADEVLLQVDPTVDLAAAVAVLGTVVGPCLRAAAHEVEILALDTTRWLEERADLHHPPD